MVCPENLQFKLRVIAALVLPLLLISAVLAVEVPNRDVLPNHIDTIGIALSILTGACFAASLPSNFWAKIGIFIIYIIFFGPLLIMYAFMFVGFVFDLWL